MPVRVDESELREIARKSAEAVKQAVRLTAVELTGNIRENSPVDHGRLAGSWNMKPTGALSYKVFTAVQYARFVNDGTGVYGPSGKPIQSKKQGKIITPKSPNGVLVFEINGKMVFAKSVKQPRSPLVFQMGGKTVHAMSVRGMRGRKYVEKSISQTERRKAEFVEIALAKVGLT
ncbi:HK97 gp10 family phage protein [Shimazuella sp. AN120528]|uniref:HK97 gp10 family phage protein n=1 Tax=Shimazuella soli TaxID=1892854 RepID=UPI001F0F65EF|nr:HK97 gp10 family phage protein [Shimazuella soli]MCH5586314.1 HK97 gp10 family phage protein [Shimazuella soli]